MKNKKNVIVLLILVLLVPALLFGCAGEKEPTVRERVEEGFKKGTPAIPLRELITEPYDKAWLVYPTTDASNHPEGFQDIEPSDRARIFIEKDGKALDPVEFDDVIIDYPSAVSIPYLGLTDEAAFTPVMRGDKALLKIYLVDDC